MRQARMPLERRRFGECGDHVDRDPIYGGLTSGAPSQKRRTAEWLKQATARSDKPLSAPP